MLPFGSRTVGAGPVYDADAEQWAEHVRLVRREESMSDGVPLGRPADIAATINFLLSEGAAYTNGATIRVDGGKQEH